MNPRSTLACLLGAALLATATTATRAQAQGEAQVHISVVTNSSFISVTSDNGKTTIKRSGGGTQPGGGGTTTITTNNGIVVITSVMTNGGAFAASSAGAGSGLIDPQAILKALKASGIAASALTGWDSEPENSDTNPVTWLGLATEEVSEEVRAQLPLPPAAGLVVRTVVKDSPAELAGVKVNDILIKLEDQLLVNGPQLRALINGKNEGDEVNLLLLRKGQETKVRAKLVKKSPAEISALEPEEESDDQAGLLFGPGFAADQAHRMQATLQAMMKNATEQLGR